MIEVYANQLIGEGSFGQVYRISPRRVVKIYHKHFSKEAINSLVNDEISGGGRTKFSLPVLRTVTVRVSGCRTTIGIVKRYIPLPASWYDVDKLTDSGVKCWDLSPKNVRKDFRGRIYIIDTQSSSTCRKVASGRY